MLKKTIIAIMTIILLSGCSNTSSNTNIPPYHTSNIKNYNNYTNSFVQSDNEYVYVGNMHSIYRAPLSTTDFECIYYDEDIYINKIALSDNNIYFSTVENLYSIDKDGNNLSHIIKMAEQMGPVFWLEFYCFNEEIYLKHNDKTVKLESLSPEITYSDPLEKLYYNPYGSSYEYVEHTEKGDGKLFFKDANIFIPENENILNENLFIFTDNYIYFVTGQNNDFSNLSKIWQCNFDGSSLKEIAEIKSQIQFVFFDDKKVYFHDYKSYYYLDISTGDIFKTNVVYQGEGVYEICDGNLYSIYTLNPFVINIKDATKKELISIKKDTINTFKNLGVIEDNNQAIEKTATVITEHIVNYSLISLPDTVEKTDLNDIEIWRFIATLFNYSDNTFHPYGKITEFNNDATVEYTVENVDIIAKNLFNKDTNKWGEKHNYDPINKTYKVSLEQGFGGLYKCSVNNAVLENEEISIYLSITSDPRYGDEITDYGTFCMKYIIDNNIIKFKNFQKIENKI